MNALRVAACAACWGFALMVSVQDAPNLALTITFCTAALILRRE